MCNVMRMMCSNAVRKKIYHKFNIVYQYCYTCNFDLAFHQMTGLPMMFYILCTHYIEIK